MRQSLVRWIATWPLLCLFLAGCGGSDGPGGPFTVNDGGEMVVEATAFSGSFCDFSGAALFAQIMLVQEGGSVPIRGADLVLLGVDGIFTVQYSQNPDADFFVDTSLILDTSDGIALVNTGGNGVGYLVLFLGGGGYSRSWNFC